MSGGFGTGPFGHTPLGEAPWGRDVHYGFLPGIHRDRDAENGYALLQYTEGVVRSADALRRLIRDFPLLRDPRAVQGQYADAQEVLLGPVVLRFGPRSQYGVDGAVFGLREFVATSARFTADDRDKYLTVSRSALPANNRTVRVVLVVSPTTVLTEPALAVDAGPLQWELRAPAAASADHVVLELYQGDPDRIRPGRVLYDGEAEFEVVGRATFPDYRPADRVAPIRAEGLDGSVDASGRFLSPTLALIGADRGVPVTLFGSAYAANVGRFLLGHVESPGVVRLLDADGTAAALVEDPGPLGWAVLPRPQVIVRGPALPLGVVEQSGLDMVIGSGGVSVTGTSATSRFTDTDVGKVVTLAYPTGARTAEVVSVSPPSAVLRALDGLSLGTGTLAWWLRSVARATAATPSPLTVRAPSLLPSLAGDFGLKIDRQESDLRQRSWVAHVAAWTKLKGTAEGYRVVGALSGADVAAEALFRVGPDVASTLPADVVLEYRDGGIGRSGTAGALSAASGRVRLTDPAAAFRPSDVGRQVRVTGSGTPANNKLYTVETYVDPTAVVFRAADTATVPDSGLGWVVARLYATEPPLLPRFDDFDADLMEELIDGLPVQATDHWSIDRWCWEEGTVDYIAVTVGATAFTPPDRYTVTVIGRADVVVSVGAWKLVDSTGRDFFLETVPAVVDPGVPTYSFEVGTVVAPALGAGRLAYVCEPALSCDYCAAAKVRLTVEPHAALTPGDVEQFEARLLGRMDEVLPAHVEAIPLFTATLEAAFGGGLGLVATVEVP